MINLSDAAAIIDSPLVTTLIGIIGTAAILVTSAVIGLFIRVSVIASTVKSIQEDISQIMQDKDLMRWSQWGPAHERAPQPNALERKR